jgi:hypothetical protein
MFLTREFWRAAGLRALYTLLVAAIPLLAPVAADPTGPVLLESGLALAFAVVASLVTSLANLPEVGNGRSHGWAILDRTVRSFFQVFAAALAAAAALSDVEWGTVLVQAGVAAATTLLRTLIAHLPEEAMPTVPGELGTAARRPMPAYGRGDPVVYDGEVVYIVDVHADPGAPEAEYDFESDDRLFTGRIRESAIERRL